MAQVENDGADSKDETNSDIDGHSAITVIPNQVTYEWYDQIKSPGNKPLSIWRKKSYQKNLHGGLRLFYNL